jgi:hypothetical protein
LSDACLLLDGAGAADVRAAVTFAGAFGAATVCFFVVSATLTAVVRAAVGFTDLGNALAGFMFCGFLTEIAALPFIGAVFLAAGALCFFA